MIKTKHLEQKKQQIDKMFTIESTTYFTVT